MTTNLKITTALVLFAGLCLSSTTALARTHFDPGSWTKDDLEADCKKYKGTWQVFSDGSYSCTYAGGAVQCTKSANCDGYYDRGQPAGTTPKDGLSIIKKLPPLQKSN